MRTPPIWNRYRSGWRKRERMTWLAFKRVYWRFRDGIALRPGIHHDRTHKTEEA